MTKRADTDHEIQEHLAARWSPYAFADRDVSDDDLCALFEAARWAPSSYNEQPWSYIVARRSDADAFARLLSCLVDANQAWAKSAPVLALGVVDYHFVRNDKLNAAAEHDLGLASANLSMEATARGLHVHQMIGIVPERAAEIYAIPEGASALTGLAIGYAGDPGTLPEPLRARDLAPRQRKRVAQFVFGSAWGVAAELRRS